MAFDLQNKKILIIDDEQTMVEIVRSLITKHNGDPLGVTTAQRGLDAAKSGDFDLIILDRYLPGHDGLEILRALKASPNTGRIPILMLTGEKETSEIQKSVELGASGYVVKPFQPKKFLYQIIKILGLHKEAPTDDFEIDI